jgi:hypothetical protein
VTNCKLLCVLTCKSKQFDLNGQYFIFLLHSSCNYTKSILFRQTAIKLIFDVSIHVFAIIETSMCKCLRCSDIYLARVLWKTKRRRLKNCPSMRQSPLLPSSIDYECSDYIKTYGFLVRLRVDSLLRHCNLVMLFFFLLGSFAQRKSMDQENGHFQRRLRA